MAMPSQHNQPDAAICSIWLQRSHMETPHITAVPCRRGRVRNVSPATLLVYFLSVMKFTLQGINFLFVQVVVCSPSRQLLGQPEPLSGSAAISTSSGALYSDSGWDFNTVGIFQIAQSIANGCHLGGIQVDVAWSI